MTIVIELDGGRQAIAPNNAASRMQHHPVTHVPFRVERSLNFEWCLYVGMGELGDAGAIAPKPQP